MKIEPYSYNADKVCKRCVMDDTVPGIEFDKDGECTFCKIHDDLKKKYPLNSNTSEKLQSLVNKIKKDGEGQEYDCIVGVSGGRDSTYTLYNAVKLGLRPLAVHFDNGWNSEIAVQNIQNACEQLDVDLHTHVANWEEFKDLQRSFLLASVPDAEVPTDWAIFSVLFKEAARNNIKHIVHGHSFRTEGTTPLSWTYMDGKYIKNIQKEFGTKKIKSFPIMNMWQYAYYSFFKQIKQHRILYYIPYDEKEIFDLLENELNWINYGDKHHESKYTSFFQAYILTRKFNIDKRKLHYSAKIRSGQILRKKALEIIKTDPYDGGVKDLEYCLKKLDLTYDEFEDIMNLPIKSFKDYNTYYPIVRSIKKPIKLINRLGIIPDTVYKKFFLFDI
ncbi:MAG: N-acetyl sugar amidotransferase [Candidatus Marinimicrobia bacterium]|nr:N-acetyl sugar amidotransferase [Candidatus Neomarinimicrobiota bacterium]